MKQKRRGPAHDGRTSLEVRPTVVLSAKVFREWRAAGNEGRSNLEGAINQAAIDLVEKYQIVAIDLSLNLRHWISACVKMYFGEEFLGQAARVTQEEEHERWIRIDAALQILLSELPRHYRYELLDTDYSPGLRAVVDAFLDQLGFIRKHTGAIHEHHSRLRKAKANKNAAKPGLKELGRLIRNAWMGNEGFGASASIPSLAAGSKYVQFATYIYAFFDEGSISPRTMINRLRAVEREEEARAARGMVITTL